MLVFLYEYSPTPAACQWTMTVKLQNSFASVQFTCYSQWTAHHNTHSSILYTLQKHKLKLEAEKRVIWVQQVAVQNMQT